MKHFIKKIFYFTITFFVCFIITGHIYVHNFLKIVNSDKAFKLPVNIYTVFFGDSHAMTAFDPEIIDNSFNGSVDSEINFQTYYKIKALLNSNPQIKNVVLSHSYHNLSIAYNQDVLYSNKYYFLLDHSGKETIHTAGKGQLLKFEYGPHNNYINQLLINLLHFANSTFIWLKYDVGLPVDANNYMNFFVTILKNNPKLNEHPLFPGKYKSNNSNLAASVTNKLIKQHFFIGHEIGASDIMIESLIKIAELCHTHKVKFILINTPLHSTFKSKIPEYYFKLHDTVLNDLKNKFDNVYYFDFSYVNYPDSLFGDGDHLTGFGMARFSEEIKDLFTK